jgi:hypothetical protein
VFSKRSWRFSVLPCPIQTNPETMMMRRAIDLVKEKKLMTLTTFRIC